jgi:hypothetical protein
MLGFKLNLAYFLTPHVGNGLKKWTSYDLMIVVLGNTVESVAS